MGFLGVSKAVYDYSPQAEGELEIKEGDILYILDNTGEDGWWKAKKKASAEDDDEPVGLIPTNYIEEAHPVGQARALFDYTRQTDEELSFTEDARLHVFDTSDPDWILVGLDGEFGFAPANYIELAEDQPPLPTRRSVPSAEEVTHEPEPEPEPEPASPVQSPAAAMANVMRKIPAQATSTQPAPLPPRPQFTPEASDEEETSPALPARPPSLPAPPRQDRRESEITSPTSPAGIAASPPYNRVSYHPDVAGSNLAPGGFHMYNINEMISVMGKRKKMPTTLGINLGTGTIMIAPEKARDGPQQEWTAEKLKNYNLEGKHVFLDLVRPSKSIEFHAGAKDTAQEIIQALGELAGATRAEGLREVLRAGSGHSQKMGKILYDFMAQGEDEVTVAVDDEVIILDDTKSEEWWQVRRVKNGNEGVVPSSYIEVTGTASMPSSMTGINSGRSTTEQNRRHEEQLARDALKSPEVGPGMKLPERGSSRRPEGNTGRSSKSKPDSAKVRTWTDRSKSFSVDAQFLTLKDGKIHLHKVNGVKIAVPVGKMSIEDLNYVERMTGISLDEDKPLSEIKKQQSSRSPTSPIGAAGAIIQPKRSEYDWFGFFLECEIAVGLCERYSQIFNKGSMDESVLPDVDAVVLRNLGIKEGDIIKIMRKLDTRYGRKKKGVSFGDEEAEGSGGLFSGPGGALRNNTRKGRPAPAVQTNDVVDATAFSQGKGGESKKPSDSVSTPLASAPTPTNKDVVRGGFDDDAWDVKPAKEQTPTAATQAAPAQPVLPPQQIARPPSAPPAAPSLTGSMQELSLLTKPLEPTKLQPQPTAAPFQQPPPQAPPQQIPQPTGANPSFFTGLGQQQTGVQPQNMSFGGQQNFGPQQMPQNMARQRPVAPQLSQGANSLAPPPPARPLSAPQAPQQNTFGAPPPLQAQMTGMPNGFQSSVAPPGTSLAEMNQRMMQQQYQQQQMQPQQTGFMQNNGMMPQQTGFGQFNNNGMQQQQPPNGYGQQFPQQQQNGFGQQPQFINGNQPQNSPFADPTGRQSQFSPIQAQPTGFQSYPQQQFPQQTGVNSFLPPPLQPQPTGQIISGFGSTSGFGQPPPVPPMRQPGAGMGAPAPLVPQPTGPPPPVRFGVNNDAKKLMPQPTGRRANLAAATPQNPFGF